MSASYVDTTIIDCNRNCSIENDAGNDTTPALFTNKQGTGLKLNAGDKVSVHSAYINEIGNTDGTLEFKGQSIKNSRGEEQTYTLVESVNTKTLEQPLDNTWSRAGDLPWDPDGVGARYPTGEEKQKWGKPTGYSEKQILQPYGFKKSSFSNVERTYVMKDNEMNMQISYYKTADGENCFHLPRRFDTHTASRGRKYVQLPVGSSGSVTPPDENTFTADTNPHISTRLYGGSGCARDHSASANEYQLLSEPGEDLLVWAYKGLQCDAGKGTPSEVARINGELPFDNAGNGACLNTPRMESMLESDWKFADMGMIKATKSLIAGAGQYQDPAGIACQTLNSLGTDARYSFVHDNSKYKIYVKEETYFTNSPTFSQFLTDAQEGEQIKPANIDAGKINDFLSYQPAGSVSAGHTAYPTTDAQLTHAYYNVRDPACTGAWIPYNEIKNVSVPAGYSSPEDIAEKVSQELNKINKVEGIFARTGYHNYSVPPNTAPTGDMSNLGANHVQVGVKKDGECFKNFYATNHGHFHDRNCKWYFVNSADGTDADLPSPPGSSLPEKSGSATRYMSAYHFLAIKRPSLYDTGKALIEPEITGGLGNTWGEFEDWTLNANAPAISWDDRATADIITSIPWSKRTLLRDMFLAQSEYPELFNYMQSNIAGENSDFKDEVSLDTFQMGNKDTGVAYARFLHFDIIKNDANCWFEDTSDGTGLKHHESRRLGSDNYRWCVNTDPLTPATAVSPDDYQSEETQTGYDVNITNPSYGTLPDNVMVIDDTKDAGYKPMYDMSSCPLWFYYDQSKAEIDADRMAYGCMTKITYGGVDYVSFSTKEIGGIPNHFFRKGGNPSADILDTAGDRQVLDSTNRIGYDRHFNAYGTKTMMLYSGYLNAVQDCKICDTDHLPVTSVGGAGGTIGPIKVTSPNNVPKFVYMAPPGNIKPSDNLDTFPMIPAQTTIPDAPLNSCEMLFQHFLGTQLGANSIALTYDADKQKRFAFSFLHTPEYIGNNFNAGEDATDPVIDDAGTQVYKINKRLSGANFCPDMVPYATDITTDTENSEGVKISISSFNNNLVPFNVVYDSPTGIMFNDFGVPKEKKHYWNKCLWGLLGFSYDQFNYSYLSPATLDIPKRMNMNSRVNPDNQGNTPEIYTNALVKSADISLYHTNSFGAHIYGEMAPSGPVFQYKGRDTESLNLPGTVNSPPITIDCTSVEIKASNQPTKMLRPYYLIKSNIVGDMKYYGAGNSTEGGQLLPIVGVVNKENGFGDYYFQTSVKNVFTITTPYTLSEVTTSIHDPDMSLARVDNNCAVLYMVEKNNANNLNLVQTLVQEKKLNPNIFNPISMTDAEYSAYFKSFVLDKAQMNKEEQAFVDLHNVDVGSQFGGSVVAQSQAGTASSVFTGMEEPTTPIDIGVSPIGEYASSGRPLSDVLSSLGSSERRASHKTEFQTFGDYMHERGEEEIRRQLGKRFDDAGKAQPVLDVRTRAEAEKERTDEFGRHESLRTEEATDEFGRHESLRKESPRERPPKL